MEDRLEKVTIKKKKSISILLPERSIKGNG